MLLWIFQLDPFLDLLVMALTALLAIHVHDKEEDTWYISFLSHSRKLRPLCACLCVYVVLWLFESTNPNLKPKPGHQL